ncbi:MAG TPA: ABC transporter permease [Spirochaetales bacterium]|nr:ABC transporter permease [Spirochaetales bacterium]
MVGRPSRRSALPGRLRFIVKRAIRTLGAFAASMLCLSAVVNASFEATVRSQIDEAAMGAVMASGSSSPEAILALRAEIRAGLERSYGLDAPSWLRVVRQTGRILRLDLGEARFDRTAYPENSREVCRIILERLPHTLALFTLSTTISIVVGIALGTAMARKPGGRLDRASSLTAMILYGAPSWWIGLFMILLLGYTFPVFKVGALHSPEVAPGRLAWALDYLAYLALPLITLVLIKLFSFAYLTRAMVILPLHEDYVFAARGRGLPEGRVVSRHGLRVAAPGLTTMAAQTFAQSIVGDILVEKIMMRPGLGLTLFSAISSNDTALFTGVLAMVTAVYCLSFLFLDIAYAWLDPRIAYGRE